MTCIYCFLWMPHASDGVSCLYTAVLVSPIQSTRGSHIHVACRSVCDQDQQIWSAKIVLDRLIAQFRGSRLILREFKGQNVAMPAKYLRKCVDRLILVAQNSSWSLDRLLKRALIAWFHFDPGCKRFSRQRLCDYIDYPLSPVHSLVQSRVQVLQRPLFLCS